VASESLEPESLGGALTAEALEPVGVTVAELASSAAWSSGAARSATETSVTPKTTPSVVARSRGWNMKVLRKN